MVIRIPNMMLKQVNGEWLTSSGIGIKYDYSFCGVFCQVKKGSTDILLFNNNLITAFLQQQALGVIFEKDLSPIEEVNKEKCTSINI